MSVKESTKAIQDVFLSGLLKGELVRKHIEQQILIDNLLPDSASFFFVVEPVTHKYHFMGKQQESLTGYANEEVMRRGVAFFLECLHPDEVNILLEKIYPEMARIMGEIAKTEDIKKISTQFNYRFKDKSGKYINLLEHLYVLETDQEGRPALFLGNIITLESKEVLPLRLTIKMMRGNGSIKIILSDTYNSEKSVFANITIRELDIIRNLAMGKTSKQIGKELFISNHTVDTHRRNLMKKLDCKSVVELARFAFQNGVL